MCRLNIPYYGLHTIMNAFAISLQLVYADVEVSNPRKKPPTAQQQVLSGNQEPVMYSEVTHAAV